MAGKRTVPAILPPTSIEAFPVEELHMCADALARVAVDSHGTTSSATNSGNDSRPVNAHHIERKRQRKKVIVKKLEKKLELYDRQIKRLSEEEVSLEEMKSVNSAYLKEDYLKRKFLNTWEDLCQLQRIPSTIEVIHEDKAYAGTPYPEINRRVQRVLRADEFPDHMDIYELVERCNNKHGLGIGGAEKLELSRKVFKEVGRIIKSRRIRDYNAHFGSHLTDAVRTEADPAIQSSTLLETLTKNLQEGKARLERLCEEFVVKQEQEGEKGGEVSPQGDTCSSDEDEEEGGDEEDEEEVGEDGEGKIGEDQESEGDADSLNEEGATKEKNCAKVEMPPPSKRVKLENENCSTAVSSTTKCLGLAAESKTSFSNHCNTSGSGSTDVEAACDQGKQQGLATSRKTDFICLSDNEIVIISDSD